VHVQKQPAPGSAAIAVGSAQILRGGTSVTLEERKKLKELLGMKRYRHVYNIRSSTDITIYGLVTLIIPLYIRLHFAFPKMVHIGLPRTLVRKFPCLSFAPTVAGHASYIDNLEFKITNHDYRPAVIRRGEPLIELVIFTQGNECPLKMFDHIAAVWKKASNGDTVVDYIKQRPHQDDFL